MEHNLHPSFSPPRKTRRRKVAPPRLGLDTSATLPGYDQTLQASAAWTRPRELDDDDRAEEVFSDKPPDYPDSAEEADEETELDNDDPDLLHQQALTQYPRPLSRHKHSFSSPFPHTASPRRPKRFAQQQAHSSPSRPSTNTAHKRRHSSVAVLKSRTDSDVDSYLDTLLERSVHALEMSNALLESSISTQATMSTLFSGPDYNSGHAESALEARAIGLSSTLLRNWDVQEDWSQQLDRIRQGVDSLLTDDPVEAEPISRSVPPAPNFSGDMSQASTDDLNRRPSSQLRLAPQDRSSLVSPPPRAMTMYVDAPSTISSPTFPREGAWASSELDRSLNSSTTSFMLPATLGARPPQPTFYGLYGTTTSTASSSTNNLVPPPSRTFAEALEPQLSANTVDPSTPAYNMLANLAARSSAANLNINASASSSTLTLPLPSSQASISMANDKERRGSSTTASAPSSFVSSLLSGVASLRRRNSSPPPPIRPGSTTSPPTRLSRSTQPPSSFQPPKIKRRSVSADQSSLCTSSSRSSRSSSRTRTLRTPSHHVRELTPPPEGTDEEASSSSDGFVAKQSMASLRRILDEQPPPPQPPPKQGDGAKDDDLRSNASNGTARISLSRKPPPAFMPRTPVVAPLAGTSTATASISRLFTKGIHTSSTRPRSPPLKSVMKRRNVDGSASVGTPSPSPSVAEFGTLTNSTPPIVVQTEQSSTACAVDVNRENGKGKEKELNPNSSLTPFGGLGNIGTLVSRALLSRSTPASRLHTPPSSGTSTPKRISFAALPESYSSTKAEGEAGSVNRKRKEASERRKQRKRGGKGGALNQSSSDDEGMRSDRSWWASWLSGGGQAGYGGYGSVRDRERVEDRATRRMGMSMGMGAGGHMSVLDEWGV